jgi:hypothetical protein
VEATKREALPASPAFLIEALTADGVAAAIILDLAAGGTASSIFPDLIEGVRILCLFVWSDFLGANRFPPPPSQGHASLENALSFFFRIFFTRTGSHFA